MKNILIIMLFAFIFISANTNTTTTIVQPAKPVSTIVIHEYNSDAKVVIQKAIKQGYQVGHIGLSSSNTIVIMVKY